MSSQPTIRPVSAGRGSGGGSGGSANPGGGAQPGGSAAVKAHLTKLRNLINFFEAVNVSDMEANQLDIDEMSLEKADLPGSSGSGGPSGGEGGIGGPEGGNGAEEDVMATMQSSTPAGDLLKGKITDSPAGRTSAKSGPAHYKPKLISPSMGDDPLLPSAPDRSSIIPPNARGPTDADLIAAMELPKTDDVMRRKVTSPTPSTSSLAVSKSKAAPEGSKSPATKAAGAGVLLPLHTGDEINFEKLQREFQYVVKEQGIVTEMEHGGKHSLDPRQQGNAEQYKASKLKKRAALFNNKSVEEAMRRLWGYLPKTPEGMINERVYKWLYSKLYFLVVPNGTKDECEELADVEWKNESQGKALMSFGAFYLGMFNFVDIWCSGDTDEEYVEYIDHVARRVVKDITQFKEFHFHYKPGQVKAAAGPATSRGAADDPYASGSPTSRAQAAVRDNTKGAKGFAMLHSKGATWKPPPEQADKLVELDMSNQRINQHMENNLSNRKVYQAECQRLALEADPRFIRELSDTPGKFDLQTLQLNGWQLQTILPLIDLIRMNKEIKSIFLKNNNLNGQSIALLCEVLCLHPGVKTLELSVNPCVTSNVADFLYKLVCRNTNITNIRMNGTVSLEDKKKIQQQAELNLHARQITREAFAEIKRVFKRIDVNGDGSITLKELTAFYQTQSEDAEKLAPEMKQPVEWGAGPGLKAPPASGNKKAGDDPLLSARGGGAATARSQRSQRQAERLAKQFLKNADSNTDMSITLPEMVKYYYPSMSNAVCQMVVNKFEGEQNAHMSIDEITEVFKLYDTDGSNTVTAKELREGMIKAGLHELQSQMEAAFRVYDINNDEELSLDEFIILMEVIDPCEVSSATAV